MLIGRYEPQFLETLAASQQAADVSDATRFGPDRLEWADAAKLSADSHACRS